MSEATITNSAQGSYPTTGGGRPSKVAIIGAGAVGSTLAYACVTKGVAREVVLQDIVKSKVEAEALDIAQGIQFTSTGSVSGSKLCVPVLKNGPVDLRRDPRADGLS